LSTGLTAAWCDEWVAELEAVIAEGGRRAADAEAELHSIHPANPPASTLRANVLLAFRGG
jgi:hypothetical protein